MTDDLHVLNRFLVKARFKWDHELKNRALEKSTNSSSLALLDTTNIGKSSGNIGYELINDLRGGAKPKSPSHLRSTPDSGHYLRSQEMSDRDHREHEPPSLTPIQPVARSIKKRTKKKQSMVLKLLHLSIPSISNRQFHLKGIRFNDERESIRSIQGSITSI